MSNGLILKDIHTSGHADFKTLNKFVAAMDPKTIIPIHTNAAEKYKTLFPDNDILVAEDGEKIGEVPVQGSIIPVDLENNEFNLLDCIQKTAETFGRIKCSIENIDPLKKECSTEIQYIARKLDVTDIQAVLLSMLVYAYDSGFFITLPEITKALNCKSILVIKHLNEFEVMEEKGYISIKKESSNYRRGEGGLSVDIPYEVFDAFRNNTAPENIYAKQLSLDDFMSVVNQLCERAVQDIEKYDVLSRKIKLLLKNNNQLTLVKQLENYNLSVDNEFILLRFCHYYIDIETDTMTLDMLERLYEFSSHFRTAKQQLKAGNHILQQKGLIEYVKRDNFVDVNSYKLTDKAKDELLADFDEQLSNKSMKGLIEPENLMEKPMFYPPKTQKEIEELSRLLIDTNFKEIQNRLKKEGDRTGFACLFSGGPGTGKTETVYQIARKTNRPIMLVDISETKSMWFGESEKKIKEVFSRYKTAAKKSKITPILLFNEADAIIGKRQNLGDERKGAGQTENTIQNIILQEIEHLDGILIATTNLAKNMDKAFERRFIYKIEFESPNEETRQSIWKSKLPALSEREIKLLASQFNFSGGLIENIARRSSVNEVLQGHPLSFDEIVGLGKTEAKESKQNKIGFIQDDL
jgi:hypothetical protein